jgi:hypothetical protein
MPAFIYTVLVLDHTTGVPRIDEDCVVGLHLHADAVAWLEQ